MSLVEYSLILISILVGYIITEKDLAQPYPIKGNNTRWLISAFHLYL